MQMHKYACRLVSLLSSGVNCSIYWSPPPPRSKSSLALKRTSFSRFLSTHLPPSRHRANSFKHLFCTSSLHHASHLSANPFFITSWSYGVFSPPFYFLFRHSSVALVCHGIRSCCSSALLPLPLVSVCLFGCLFLYLYIRACVCAGIWVLFLCLSCQCFGSRQPSFLSFRCNYTLTKCLIPSSDICCVYPCFTPPPLYRSHLYLVYLPLSSHTSLFLSLFDILSSHQDFFQGHLSL